MQRATAVLVSIAKRMLQFNIPADFRLKFLEQLDRIATTDRFFPSEVITTIEPACDRALELAGEIQKLGPQKALDVFGRDQVWESFIALNPSLSTALKEGARLWPARSATS